MDNRNPDTLPGTCAPCGYGGPHHLGRGAGPHVARLTCGRCGAFVRWLSKLEMDAAWLGTLPSPSDTLSLFPEEAPDA